MSTAFLLVAIAGLHQVIFAQVSPSCSTAYFFPSPDAEWVVPGSNLIFRPSEGYGILDNLSWGVEGSQSGRVTGTTHYVETVDTWVFVPTQDFELGENVKVELAFERNGRNEQFLWSFTVRKKDLNKTVEYKNESWVSSPSALKNSESDQFNTVLPESKSSLPAFNAGIDRSLRLPDIHITSIKGGDSGSKIFAAPYSEDSISNFHLVFGGEGDSILLYQEKRHRRDELYAPYDEYGKIVKYDFATNGFAVYDTSLTLLYNVGSEDYYTDFHDMQFLPNGNVLILGIDTREIVRNDEIVTVQGTSIEEMTTDGLVVFVWLSLDDDSIAIEDAAPNYVDFSSDNLDYMHTNSVDLDDDGNLLISCRHMNAVFKIDWTTAGVLASRVIWKMGGERSTIEVWDGGRPFHGQHFARRLENGHLLLFDNGMGTFPFYARAAEYVISEEGREASIVWEYDHDRSVISYSRGSAQRLPNGNTMICWGSVGEGDPHATEVDPDGNIVWEITFGDSTDRFSSYQVLASTMTLLAAKPFLQQDPGSARLLFTKLGDTEVSEFAIHLGHSGSVFPYDTTAATSYEIPSVFSDYDTLLAQVEALYPDGREGVFSDIITIDMTTVGLDEIVETCSGLPLQWALLKNWPNPFNESTEVAIDLRQGSFISVDVFNLLGQRVQQLYRGPLSEGVHVWGLKSTGMGSGIYLLRVHDRAGKSIVRKITLLR